MENKILSLKDFIGMQLIYTYDNGWEYEIYIKNENTMDYRMHNGPFGGRWIKDQKINLAQILPGVFKVAWSEVTGTDISLDFILSEKKTHGDIFFPKWVGEHPELTICYQNDHIDEVKEAREKFETYPRVTVSEFSKITFMQQRGVNNEKVIDRAPYTGIIADIKSGKI